MTPMIRTLAMASLLWLSGCSSLVPVPEVPPGVSGDPLQAWADVLAAHVDELGRVNFDAVAKDPAKLKLYVNYVSKNGPKTTPKAFLSKDAVLAHYLNSYNALSMYNIIDAEIPETLSGLLRKAKFFYFKKFIIDGEEMSLYAYENDIIRKVGEERVHFALNCMSAGCPRLPRKPFTGAKLEAELQAEALRFFNEDRNVQVDTREKEVRLSEILKFFTEDFLKKAPNLIEYANKYRSEKQKLPTDYEVDFISYDWTVNRQPGAAPKG
jgi:hypothetical protein